MKSMFTYRGTNAIFRNPRRQIVWDIESFFEVLQSKMSSTYWSRRLEVKVKSCWESGLREIVKKTSLRFRHGSVGGLGLGQAFAQWPGKQLLGSAKSFVHDFVSATGESVWQLKECGSKCRSPKMNSTHKAAASGVAQLLRLQPLSLWQAGRAADTGEDMGAAHPLSAENLLQSPTLSSTDVC
ncbi:Testosterone 17-Beta-Dehydrogenase 3 [Manis pentadactyla]|nr:Testosterone 17-Beta-Dehydrogenase 3 [Manis pentadactyla]